jgi:Fur family transcriptional regulator, ferric uptake regulator
MVRNTRTKKKVEKVFISTPTPIDLEGLFKKVKESLPSTAYSTIYRIVNQLLQENKIIKVDWRQRSSKYEWADRPHHHHVVCETCDTVVDIDDSILRYNEEELVKKTGFLIKAHTIEVSGICQPCQTKN